MRIEQASRLVDKTIFIIGAPRSGTTWLGKIIDSHPDVLYRHEPDEVLPPTSGLSSASQITMWIAGNSIRAAGKRPFFNKAWMGPLAPLYEPIAALCKGVDRYLGSAAHVRVPDLGAGNYPRLRPALKLVAWDGTAAAQALQGTRTLFIIRHPCGQIASTLAGRKEARFLSQIPDEDYRLTVARASRSGVRFVDFPNLPEVEQMAWTWLAFNERVIANMASNMKVVLYEELCRDPVTVSRDLFDFVGLDWNPQTDEFLRSSSTASIGTDEYYGVMRVSTEAADKWRTTLSERDQSVIRDVVRHSPLARYWPDTMPAAMVAQ